MLVNVIVCVHYSQTLGWTDILASLRGNYLSLGLDGCSMVQQDLYDSDMPISGCTMQRSQLILEKEDG